MEGTDGAWRGQMECGGDRQCVEETGRAWGGQAEQGGDRQSREGTDGAWREQAECGGDRLLCTGTAAVPTAWSATAHRSTHPIRARSRC